MRCILPTGENVREFFFRVAALAFEASLLKDLKKKDCSLAKIGEGNTICKFSKLMGDIVKQMISHLTFILIESSYYL